MASTLASQLQAIASHTGVPQRGPRGKPSLLYEPSQAADIDVQTIYSVGLGGESP